MEKGEWEVEKELWRVKTGEREGACSPARVLSWQSHSLRLEDEAEVAVALGVGNGNLQLATCNRRVAAHATCRGSAYNQSFNYRLFS